MRLGTLLIAVGLMLEMPGVARGQALPDIALVEARLRLMSTLNVSNTSVPYLILAPPEGTPIPFSLRELPPPTTFNIQRLSDPAASDPSEVAGQLDEGFFEVFLSLMDADQNGVWSKEELRTWFSGRVKAAPNIRQQYGNPGYYNSPQQNDPTGDMTQNRVQIASSNQAADPWLSAECSAELVEQQRQPKDTGISCGQKVGDRFYRTVCNMPGYDRQTIQVHDGKEVGCFLLMTPWKSSDRFTIYEESDPATILYDSAEGADGQIEMGILNLGVGTYMIDLDETMAEFRSRVVVSFIELPGE